jgi:hypothetical protein
MDITAPAPGIQRAASLLAAYLDTDALPTRVELCCLLAGDELHRAGADNSIRLDTAGPVEVRQVLDTLLDLPPDVFDNDHVLDAVAALTDALDALQRA